MHSTKTEILALLKRSDGSTVDELATSLGLASMTVRQHLTALERDGAVEAEGVRRATGRPHYRYRLTADGHRRVSDGYDRLTTLLVEQVGRLEAADLAGIGPEERRATLFRMAARSLAERNQGTVSGLTGRERIEHVAGILRAHGGFAEWHELGNEYELRDFGCVYRSSGGNGASCAWHETFLAELLKTEIKAAAAPTDCADCCRYVIPAGIARVSH